MGKENTSETTYRRIIRLPDYSKQQFLYFLTNKLGFDVEICYTYTIGDTILFSPWKSFLWLLQYDPEEYISELYMSRDKFIEKATHRSVLDIELLVDIDDKGTFRDIKAKKRYVVNKLEISNIIYACYFSGGKGFHISILIPELKNYSERERANKKIYLLKLIGGDILKGSTRTMISLEGEPHRVTGKLKEVSV